MKVSYHYSESNSRPNDIEVSSSTQYIYVRRNIKEVETEGGNKKYVYEEATITKDEFETYKNELLVKLINSQDNTSEFDTYLNDLNTPVEYENGHTYKPKWADAIYYGLIQKGFVFPELFPMKIYDSTGKDENAVEMTLEELKSLALFLELKKEELFLKYKQSVVTL